MSYKIYVDLSIAVTRPTKAPKVTTTKQTKTTEGKSPSPNTYSPCDSGNCDNVQDRPNLGLGASVYVVFGIEDLDRSNVSRRLTSELVSLLFLFFVSQFIRCRNCI